MMKYLSIDIETTGLNPQQHQIIEFGAVLDNNSLSLIDDLPQFHCYINHYLFKGDAKALAMNAKILNNIADRNGLIVEQENFLGLFQGWLAKHIKVDESITIAGKNFAGFDAQFLLQIQGITRIGSGLNFGGFRTKQRVLDPAMLFWNPDEDEVLPDLNTCLKRAGLDQIINHTAINDAKLIIILIRIGAEKLRNL